MKCCIPLWWISACTASEILKRPVERMDHILYVQGKGCLGSSHTVELLIWFELAFEPNTSPTHIQERQTLPRDLFSTRSCALPAKENKHPKKKKALLMQLEFTQHSVSPSLREQWKTVRWLKFSLWLKGFSVEFLDFSFSTL